MTNRLGLASMLSIMILIVSCNHNKGEDSVENENRIDFNVNENQTISSLVDSVTYIPLKESERHIITDASKISTSNGYFVIGSKKLAKVTVYSQDGEFQYEINRRGHGKGEYLEIANFTNTDSVIYILDNFQHSIHKFSLNDGAYLETDKIPFIAWDMEAFDDDCFLFTMIRNNKDAKFDIDHDIDHAVWETNGKWEVTNSFLPMASDYVEMYGKQRFFTKNDDTILFHTLKDNGYYRFKKSEKPHFIPFGFDNPLPQDFNGDLEEAINRKYEYIAETPIEAGGLLITSVSSDGLEEQYVYDSNQKQFFRNSSEDAHNGLIEVVGCLKSSPVGYLSDFDTYQSLVKYGFTKADSITENILQNGGAAMVVYSMKKR